MKKGNLFGGILAAAVVILALVLAVKLVSGTFGLVRSAMDTVLGIVLVVAMILLVAWMLRYATKKRK